MTAHPTPATPLPLTHRAATPDDCALLARLNHQLIQDEGHRNPMSVAQLQARIERWLASEYAASLFHLDDEMVAYALYRVTDDEIYLRQLFVVRSRRRQGIGRTALALLRSHVWPANRRLTVDVLVSNRPAVAFWRAAGYRDYALTLEIVPNSPA